MHFYISTLCREMQGRRPLSDVDFFVLFFTIFTDFDGEIPVTAKNTDTNSRRILLRLFVVFPLWAAYFMPRLTISVTAKEATS